MKYFRINKIYKRLGLVFFTVLIISCSSKKESFISLKPIKAKYNILFNGNLFLDEGVKKLEDLGATEVIVAFRNAYEGGPDERTLDGMIAEINWYAEEVIQKTR